MNTIAKNTPQISILRPTMLSFAIELNICRVNSNQMEDSNVTKHRGRPRKITDETVKRDLHINGLDINMIYDRAL